MTAASQRNRRALLILGIAVALYVISSQGLLPLYDQLRAASGTAAGKTDELKKYRRELSHRGNYEALKADRRKKLDELRTHFFTNDAAGAAELQRIVEDDAKTVGVDLMQRSMSQPKKIDEQFSELTMTTSFEATPNQLVAFLNQLRAAPKVVNVRNAQVDPAQIAYEAPKQGELRKNVRVNVIITGVALAASGEKSEMTFRRLLLLDLVIVAVIVAGVVRFRRDVQKFSAGHRVDQIQPDSDKPLPKALPGGAIAAKQEWADIAVHNPFSFDRNDVALVVAPPAAQQPKRPKPMLYGTILLGKDLMAMLSPADASSKFSRPVRAGEVFDGWTVVEIQEKTVTVRWDQTTESLVMNDPTAQVARDYSKTTGGNAPPAAPTPVLTIAPSIPAAPAPAPSASSFAPQTTTISPTGKKQITVHTPFGDKIMDDPNQ